jgi:hypothetical protein
MGSTAEGQFLPGKFFFLIPCPPCKEFFYIFLNFVASAPRQRA